MKKPLRKRCKAKTYNMILSLYIVVMILANANLVYGISDIHEDRVKDGSITYDHFELGKEKVKYKISKCMYVEMFLCYGIRQLCKIFCNTDRIAYSGLTRHVRFVRHSDLSDGDTCHDEIIKK